MADSERHPGIGWDKLKGGIPFAMILPAINSVFYVPVRVERRLNVVQYIEAIRLYAADHNGTLPPKPGGDHRGAGADRSRDREVFRVQGRRLDRDPERAGASRLEQYSQFKIRYELKLAR